MAFKIWQDGDTLYAADLNGSFQSAVITSGNINGTAIGSTTPAAGFFTNVTAQTLTLTSPLNISAPAQNDNSNAAVTSAWVTTKLANYTPSGGGSSGTTYTGAGTPGILSLNATGGFIVRNAAEFPAWNFYTPGVNAGWGWMNPSSRVINGIHYGGIQGGGSFTWALYVGGTLQTITGGGATAGASVTSITLATPLLVGPYTLIYFTITAVSGTVNSGMLQPYGNWASA